MKWKSAFFSVCFCFVALGAALSGQVAPAPRIRGPIEVGKVVILRGNTHPLARAEFDQGVAPADLPMERMHLVLTRSAAQQAALEKLLADQQDSKSPQYHRWLSPDEFGQQFGPALADIQKITAWLTSYGFKVEHVAKGRNLIEFSGSAGQVEHAFHTQIRKYVVNGKSHWANASDLSIPAALAEVVAGVRTLHNFAKKSQAIVNEERFEATFAANGKPQFTSSTGLHALSPGDFQRIYGGNYFLPTLPSTVIGVVARTNINLSDIASFNNAFGSIFTMPQIVVNGTDPGDLGGGEEGEAVLDTSWAAATGWGATVKVVISASTNTADGVDLSEAYIIDNNLADVMTESFGNCEANVSQAEATAIASLAAQAAAQGITYLVAAGDSGAAGCDAPNAPPATGPLSVNVLASSPYTLAVGGTQFNENGNDAAYWSASNSNGTSALSYIPENAWNESCATTLTCPSGYSPGLWATGGGASRFFAKPWWQTGVPGIPNDGARDVPDVALSAAGHDPYLICLAGSCTPNSNGRFYFRGIAGTSAATPAMAGIMAQVAGAYGRVGLANPTLYKMAAAQNAPCNASSTTSPPASNCIFNDVTGGNNAVPGESGYGTSNSRYQAGQGYDLATGLGSIHISNLITNWLRNTQLAVTISPPSLAGVSLGNTPLVGASPLSGIATFSGTASDSNFPVTTVTLLIDGSPFASENCASTSCSWSFNVDTAAFSNGLHTMDVFAVASNGQTASRRSEFTVANWTAANPTHISIDSTVTQTGSTATITGWAVDDVEAIASIRVSVDGSYPLAANVAIPRTDACVTYPGRTGCPNVGWQFTTSVAAGSHTLAVTATTSSGRSSTVPGTFSAAPFSSPVVLTVDSPGSAATIKGVVQIAGWAVNSTSPIVSVGGYIDGFIPINATYGGVRTDVCAVYTTAIGCPNVGWNMLFDTAGLADGVHSLTMTAASQNGSAQSTRQFTVANGLGFNNSAAVDIDYPSNQLIVDGSIFTFGWALGRGSSLVYEVAISVDDSLLAVNVPGDSRPDVCQVFPTSGNCPIPGWHYWLDTTHLANGAHILRITAQDPITPSHPLGQAQVSFTVANWSSNNPFHTIVDVPSTSSAPLTGQRYLAGWAINDQSAVAKVAVTIDGKPFGTAQYGVPRPDVCVVFPGRPGCPNVGWTFPFNTALLADGAHVAEITATAQSGGDYTIPLSFTTDNSSPGQTVLSIDIPAPNVVLSGQAHIGGWALYKSGAESINSVEISVDDNHVGFAIYGGLRNDVCAIFSSAAGCPDVGWNYSLNTNQLTNGQHRLQVRATTSTGEIRTSSQTFVVFN